MFLCQSYSDQVNQVLGSSLWCVCVYWEIRDADPKQTPKAIYIIIATPRDGAPVTTLERKIPLVTIKTISMSNLRDDWMVRQQLPKKMRVFILSRSSILMYHRKKEILLSAATSRPS